MSDTLYVLPGAIFYPDLDGAPADLLGMIAVTIVRKSDETAVVARSTDGIAENPEDSGHYQATRTAPDERGEYSVVWDDGSGPSWIAFDDLVVTYDLPDDAPGEGVDWTPTVAEVAAYIRARTKVSGGKEVGTFTENTRPTQIEVELLIGQAVDHVSAAIGGDPCNEQLKRSARVAAALYTAVLVEVSYFPETSAQSGSSAVRLEALFNARLKSLTSAVAEQCGGQGEGDSGGSSGSLAAGSFSDGYALIGRDYPARW